MKALVLSAGLGTRLRPYSNDIPKPMFPICGRPVIDIIIKNLIDAGTTAIAVNTHYMADKIESFLKNQDYGSVDILVRHETALLGTGGAVGNFYDFFSKDPFVVINSDILTDIDIREIYKAHIAHRFPVTLVMHDYPIFNKVSVSEAGFIEDFSEKKNNESKLQAFTGISIIDPLIYRFIDPAKPCCILDIYRRMMHHGEKIKAHTVSGHYWNDLGTPERYRDGVIDYMAPRIFKKVHGHIISKGFEKQKLAGDGSDRKWYRIKDNKHSLILADHGIHTSETTAQIDAFLAIGRHLSEIGIPVPEIFATDRVSGIAFVEDLGDTLFQEIVSRPPENENSNNLVSRYRSIIEILVKMSIKGKKGFNPDWAYEGTCYDKKMIIERECHYFTRRFLKDYLGFSESLDQMLSDPFNALSESIQANAYIGLMHRDLQSRNIMVKNGRYYFIDFQGARIGPIQYDLASLLTDPYVNLNHDIRDTLLDLTLDIMDSVITVKSSQERFDRHRFTTGYHYCCISRLMQALGAYAFLSMDRKKTWFEQYIPTTLNSLKYHLEILPDVCSDTRLANLTEIVKRAHNHLFQPGKISKAIESIKF